MADLTGKVALVTGATRSIGEYIARGFHAAGATVFITGIEEESGKALAAALGDRAVFRYLDMRSDDDMDAVLETIANDCGRLDYVVNCACSYLDSGLGTPRDHWLDTLNVNTVGPAILTHKARGLLSKSGGVVVNIGSVSGKYGSRSRGPYSVSKAGLMHLTRLTAVALASEGIRCVTVTPAWTWSPPVEEMTNNNQALADRAAADLHPLGRMGRMEEVANAVLFVCSDQASWINGCDIPVDGGYTALGPDRGRGPKFFIDASRLPDE